jgi:isoleucyl-tRNA synthetase
MDIFNYIILAGATLYRCIFFLSSKFANATLKAFQEFHVESEQQMGKKLKRVCLDMGRKWHNALWDRYIKQHGVILDFTTPYAHQQNRKAKHSMRTLLNMAHTMLANLGLPQKF